MNELYANWSKLSSIIRNLYSLHGLEDHFDCDISYLEKAYFEVERLWFKAFDNINTIQLLLFAEAPMFGPKKSYFYNPAAAATEFFTYADAEEIVGPLADHSKLINGIRPRKLKMLNELCKAGLLIVDLFPFALKPDFTKIDYSKMDGKVIYTDLFANTIKNHIGYKLNLIQPKINKNTNYAFRYARVKNQLEPKLLSVIKSYLDRSIPSIVSIHLGRNLDKLHLKKLLLNSINANKRDGATGKDRRFV